MNDNWANKSIFYHIYPIGMLGALYENDFISKPINRLNKIENWIDHFKELYINALYLGPLFESDYHGYETVDYYTVDRRLGTNDDLKKLIETLHNNGVRAVLDGVFNHCSRNFWAFKDLLLNKSDSIYKDWFHQVDFNKNNPFNDGFSYHGWKGHLNLVKFNHKNKLLTDYLLNSVENMIKQFDIDGLRLDAADCIDIDFLKVLSSHCKSIKKDFWLMGEIIHGDYNKWANCEILDSTTNYECYKGLYSSHNDNNYFEIAYSLNRQFGKNGIYKNLFLYNFADNHDVDRIASTLINKTHLYPLHILLFTMPGIPSIYYGSEFGIYGKRTSNSDIALRPELSKENYLSIVKHKDLNNAIKKLASLRQSNDSLIYGDYEEILVSHNHFVFKRKFNNTTIIVAVNSNNKDIEIELPNRFHGNKLIDILNNNEAIVDYGGKFKIKLYKNWGRIMLLQ